MQKLKADSIIIGIILLTAFLFFLVPRLIHSNGENARVEIRQNGTLIHEYPLDKDRTVTVKGGEEYDGYNLILISAGTVKVTDATCPDKLCIRQKSISKDGESIICLPHKLVVEIVSEEESGLDAVAN